MISEGIIESMKQDVFKAIVILVVLLGLFALASTLFSGVESETSPPVTQVRIDEETRCFYQGDRLVNCEKYHPDNHP